MFGGGKDVDIQSIRNDKEAFASFVKKATHRTDIEISGIRWASEYRYEKLHVPVYIVC